MKSKNINIPFERIWVEVKDLKSALDVWQKIQHEMTESPPNSDLKDYDEV